MANRLLGNNVLRADWLRLWTINGFRIDDRIVGSVYEVSGRTNSESPPVFVPRL
jgi:hypothetical protein